MTAPVLSLLNARSLEEFYRLGYWRDETIYGVLQARAERSPDRFALRDRYRRLSYRELKETVDAFAADLTGRGLAQGQRVALWMPDRIESVVALLACSRNGLVCCPSPHGRHTVAEIVTLMERMRGAALLYQAGFGVDADRCDIGDELRHLGSLRHIFRLAPNGPDIPEAPLFDGALDAAPGADGYRPPAGDPDGVSYLAFTSGSTGHPKGVMHSDNTLLVTARAISADWRIGLESVVYSMSPFCHNLGIGTLLTSLVGGAEFVIHDLTRREGLVDRLVETGTTYLVGVPTHAIDLLAEMRLRGLSEFGQIKGFRISGAAVPVQVVADLLRYGVTPQSGYGMTETNAHQYTRPDDDPALMMESCGRACAGYEIRIWDEDDPDVEMPVGQMGQIGGRGACLMLGYFDDQIATEASFNVHGWFMTGDLGWVDENGYLRITGRKKEVIIRGGHNINPALIEEMATRHAGVANAAAVPVADPRLGERVCLALTYRPEAKTTARQVLDHLAAAGLSPYDMPEFILELADIPLMSNGKIHKRDIVAWIREGRAVPIPVHTSHGD